MKKSSENNVYIIRPTVIFGEENRGTHTITYLNRLFQENL